MGGNILWSSGNAGPIQGHTRKYIPETGTWIPVGKTQMEWLNDNGYTMGPNVFKVRPGESRKKHYIKDSKGNTIGRIDKGYSVNGKAVPDHAHLDSDVGNVHHWFNDK